MSTLKVNNLQDLGADAVVTNGVIASSALPAGSIVAVESVTKTDTFSASVATGASVAITGVSITHSLANAANKLLVTAFIGAGANSGQRAQFGAALADDGTLVNIGASAGSRTSVTTGLRVDSDGTDNTITASTGFTFLYEPGDTASHTYALHMVNNNTTTQTLYANRASDDSDTATRVRAVTALTIQEVAG